MISLRRAATGLVLLAGAAAAARPLSSIEALPRAMALASGATYMDQRRVIRQRSGVDCGVAALEMMFDEFGRSFAAADSARRAVDARGRGLSFADLQRLALGGGLIATGWFAGFDQLRALTRPAIAYFPGHYLVVDSVSRNGAVFLRDPAVGRIRMRAGTFRRRWTGRMLVFSADSRSMP